MVDKISLDAEDDDTPTIISRNRGAKSNDAITSLRGRRLAHFELMEPVGVGGMGAVIRAHDLQLDRTVALKVLPPHQAADPDSIRRFHQEARAAAKLDHENIARAFYCGHDQGLHFIAFEFVEGENLLKMLERRDQIPVGEAVRFMLQVATGLAHAAERGVVHRDIKPSNIIISPTGRAKLVDMGLARNTEPTIDRPVTQSGVTLGTFDYISPEQALEPSLADFRSDIYSLGCTFYHMLTGQSPVPEGTVARKLHFHEHEWPVDPRQLQPGITDEVAAVLAKMMAKDPKDRYQRPEHLVQHLLQLANNLGETAQVPEGFMFVDAPLANPPKTRPILVASLAAVVLVVLVILLGSVAGPAVHPKLSQTWHPTRPTNKKTIGNPPHIAKKENPKKTNPKVMPPAKTAVAHNVKELQFELKKPSVDVLLSSNRFELGSDVPGLVFRGQQLKIEGKLPDSPTIQLTYSPLIRSQQWVGLDIQRGNVTIRNVRFEIDPKGTTTVMAGVVVREGASLTLENCEFVHKGLPLDRPLTRHISSVQVGGIGVNRTSLIVNKCFFSGGDRALLVDGQAYLDVKNSAFGPHKTICQVAGEKVPQASIGLQYCSAFLPRQSEVFLIKNGASCKLAVNDCLFASSAAFASTSDEPVLIRQSGEQTREVEYRSTRRNVFYGLGAFWVREDSRGSRVVAETLEAFRQSPAVDAGKHSVVTLTSPWNEPSPLDLLVEKPAEAYRINIEPPELRQSGNQNKPVGLQTCLWGDLYAGALPPPKLTKPPVVVRTTKIVDPELDQVIDGKYPSIEAAYLDSKTGDTILIRCNGEMPIGPIRTKPDVEVTIKPDGTCRPVLILGQAVQKNESLFQIHSGTLIFEDLEFYLKPVAAIEKLSVISLTGGQCTFRHCVVTLDAGEDVGGLVVLPTPNRIMPRPPETDPPRIVLRDCFVRGQGTLVELLASQPCELDVKNSLIALNGTFLSIEGSNNPPAMETVDVALDHVTAVLSDHLVDLHGLMKAEMRPMPGLLPTHINAANCLFHSATGIDSRTLVHVRGIDTDQQVSNLFIWQDGDKNTYSNYRYLLDHEPRMGVMALESFDQAKWEGFTQSRPRFTKAKFTHWPRVTEVVPLTQAMPGDFGVKEPMNITGSGATLSKVRSPAPAVEPLPAPSSPED